MIQYFVVNFMFKIGNVEIKNNIVLAPMAGVSNYAFMKICEEMGVGYVVTELLSAEAIVRNNKKTLEMLKGIDKLNIPVGIQLFGSNASSLARAAKIIEELYPNALIDINMGCPVPKVAIKSQAGSSLLKNPAKVYEIVSEVVKAVSIPVTVKIRSGWDENSINAIQIAKLCEKAGASLVTVHGRTRSQGYSGKCNLDVIRDVKKNVGIPVIGNGDITDIESAKKMFDYTRCDAIMIGRAALGNPWLIRELVEYFDKGIMVDKPSAEEKINMCFYHLERLLEVKPERVAILEMRSFVSWYIKGLPNAVAFKNELFKVKTKENLVNLLNNYFKELKNSIK